MRAKFRVVYIQIFLLAVAAIVWVSGAQQALIHGIAVSAVVVAAAHCVFSYPLCSLKTNNERVRSDGSGLANLFHNNQILICITLVVLGALLIP